VANTAWDESQNRSKKEKTSNEKAPLLLFREAHMQNVVYTLLGNNLVYSLILIIGATLPFVFLLTSIIIMIKTKTTCMPHSSHGVEFQQRLATGLVALALLVCLVFGMYLLQASQSPMLLVLRLGILPGLVLGILLGIWAQTMSVQISLYGAIYSLLMSPLILSLYIKARQAGETFHFLEMKVFFLPVSFLLVYGVYAFWIAQQTGSTKIGFWSTLASALVTALIATNISLLLEATKQIIHSPQKLSLARLSVLAWSYRSDCTAVMGLVLPLLLLALIGGLIGSFPA
jgi:hypothetical protein